MSTKHQISIGFVLGVLPSVGLAWAFAVQAAHTVMDPHMAESKARVAVMCVVAKANVESQRELCAALGTPCAALVEARALLDTCKEPNRGQ